MILHELPSDTSLDNAELFSYAQPLNISSELSWSNGITRLALTKVLPVMSTASWGPVALRITLLVICQGY